MKTVIATDAGARPVGPYSQAIRANGLIFVSGQIPFDPETAAIVDGGIAAQTDRALRNVAAILTAAVWRGCVPVQSEPRQRMLNLPLFFFSYGIKERLGFH